MLCMVEGFQLAGKSYKTYVLPTFRQEPLGHGFAVTSPLSGAPRVDAKL